MKLCAHFPGSLAQGCLLEGLAQVLSAAGQRYLALEAGQVFSAAGQYQVQPAIERVEQQQDTASAGLRIDGDRRSRARAHAQLCSQAGTRLRDRLADQVDVEFVSHSV